jgi:hypothetical protein
LPLTFADLLQRLRHPDHLSLKGIHALRELIVVLDVGWLDAEHPVDPIDGRGAPLTLHASLDLQDGLIGDTGP